MDFHTRGKRSEEQVRFMQALWANPSVTFDGKYHQLTDGGLNPRPKSGKVPVWFGGPCRADAEARGEVRRRLHAQPLAAGRRGAGDLRAAARHDQAEGRDPKDVGLDVWVSMGKGNEEDWHKECAFWKKAGATHITAHTTFASAIHTRIAGKASTIT